MPESSTLLITGGTVVTMDPQRQVLKRGAVLVRDGRVAAVGVDVPSPPDAEIVDASGCAVIPGLINAHTHLFQTLLRGAVDNLPFSGWLGRIYAYGRRLEPEDCYAGALVGAVESLLGGVTTVVEHHFVHPGLEFVHASVQALRQAGIRARLARTAMDTGALVPDEVRETPSQAEAACARLLAGLPRDQMLDVLVGANTPGISSSGELALAMHRVAMEHGLGVSSHCAESLDAVAAVRAATGAEGIIDWLHHLGVLGAHFLSAHTVHVTEREIGQLATSGTAVVHNPVSNMYLGDGAAPVVALRRAGVRVALGTDGAASNNTQDMFEVMKSALLLQRVVHRDATVIAPAAALEMATVEAAKALRMDDLVGSLEPGKRADLAVVDLSGPHHAAWHDVVSQVVYCARPSDVRLVVVDGRIVMRDRRVLTADAGDAAERARRRARMLARA